MNCSRCALFAIAGALLAAAPASAAAPAPTWQPAVTVSSAASSNSAPQIAVNARGDSAAVWTETVNGKSVVRGASRVAGAGWSAPAKVPAGPVASTPRVGIDGAGRVYSAWAAPQNSKQPVLVSVTSPGGSLSVTTLGDLGSAPALAVNADGEVVAAWLARGANGYVVVASVRSAKGLWTAPHRLSPDYPDGPVGINAAIDSQGDAAVAWNAYGVVSASVQLAGSGDWKGEVLSSPKEAASTPRVALDGGGRATVVWQSTSASDGYSVIDGAESSVAGDFGKVKAVAAEGASKDPSLAVGADGRAALAFVRDNGGHAVVQAVGRTAPGDAWTSATPLSPALKNSDSPDVAVDGSGNAVVVWDQKAVVGNVAYASALRAAGGGWSSPHALANPAPSPTTPQVAFDSAGDALTAFANGYPIETADYDAAPALSAVQVPASVPVGVDLSFSASASDLWSPVAIAWNFGDGTTGSGSPASHAYAGAGDYTVTVSATDARGNTSTEMRTVHVDGGSATPPSAPGTGIPPVQPRAFRGLKIKRQTLKVRHGVVRVKASCPVATVDACAGTLKLVARHNVVGHARFRVHAGKRAQIRVRVVRIGRVRATARAHDGAGAKRTTGARLKLRRG